MADGVTPLAHSVRGEAWPGLRFFCTVRHGGFSTGAHASFNLAGHVADDARNVARNRRLLRAALPAEPLWLSQVHGTAVFDADARDAAALGGAAPDAASSDAAAQRAGACPPAADAAVTATAGRVLCIMTADCLPVVIADTQGRVLGAAHAGWRGLAGGVLENTLAELRRRLPGAQGWRAWLGPAISQRHFEVGPDVLAAFARDDERARDFFIPRTGAQGIDAADRPPRDKWMADLPGLAAWRLRRAGVDQVEDCGLCTYARSDLFYSYRRDGVTGRMATLAWLEPAQGR